jgi:hypothetical protein|tara:strand:+ start:1432 stop:1647 length:216 start_codon:yes stop_codon:yes gene_type:complete
VHGTRWEDDETSDGETTASGEVERRAATRATARSSINDEDVFQSTDEVYSLRRTRRFSRRVHTDSARANDA